MMTRISIVTATYDCAATIEESLASIASQTHSHREHIVVDGGSRDGTLDVLEKHRAALAHLVSEPDEGIYDALNKGVALASGDVVGFLHSDDIYAAPDVLARVAAAFADTEVFAVYGDLVYVMKNAPDRVLRYWKAGSFSHEQLRYGWMPPHPTLFLRRWVYERYGSFDPTFRIAADYDFMLRILTQNLGKVAYLPSVLIRMRAGGASNRSLGNIIRKSVEDLQALCRNRVGGIGTLVFKNLRKITQFWPRR